jgi:hypothetical protein
VNPLSGITGTKPVMGSGMGANIVHHQLETEISVIFSLFMKTQELMQQA